MGFKAEMIIKTSYELIDFLQQFPDTKVLVHASGYPTVSFEDYRQYKYISIVGNNRNKDQYDLHHSEKEN